MKFTEENIIYASSKTISLPNVFISKPKFFDGYSVPRNQEIMRIFKDLDLVEHLGSGVPRILESYGKDCFTFSDNFLRMTFPAAGQVNMQVNMQVKKLIDVLENEMDRKELQNRLRLSNRDNFRKNYLKAALEEGLIEMTIPDKPNSSLQKYRLTEKGMSVKQSQ